MMRPAPVLCVSSEMKRPVIKCHTCPYSVVPQSMPKHKAKIGDLLETDPPYLKPCVVRLPCQMSWPFGFEPAAPSTFLQRCLLYVAEMEFALRWAAKHPGSQFCCRFFAHTPSRYSLLLNVRLKIVTNH